MTEQEQTILERSLEAVRKIQQKVYAFNYIHPSELYNKHLLGQAVEYGYRNVDAAYLQIKAQDLGPYNTGNVEFLYIDEEQTLGVQQDDIVDWYSAENIELGIDEWLNGYFDSLNEA